MYTLLPITFSSLGKYREFMILSNTNQNKIDKIRIFQSSKNNLILLKIF